MGRINKYLNLLYAWWNESRNLDTGCSVHCIDHRLLNTSILISNKVGGGVFPHLMLGDEVARLGELEQQFGLVKNSAADMKAAGVPGGLKYISGTHSGVPEGGMAV